MSTLGLTRLVRVPETVRDAATLAACLVPGRGRRLRLSGVPLALTVRSVVALPWPGGLRELRLVADEVDWNGLRIDHLRLVARDVRLRPGSALSTGRVSLSVVLDERGLVGAVGDGLPYACLRLTDVGVRASLRSRPDWLAVDLTPAVDAGDLVLVPVGVVLRSGRRLDGPARLLPRLRIASQALLPGVRLVRVAVAGGRLHLAATLDRWSAPVRDLSVRRDG